jgi:hypothetical protein
MAKPTKAIKYTTATPAELKELWRKQEERKQKRRAQWEARAAGQLKPKPESANRITANIIRLINMQSGCYAFRVNNVGVWDAAKQIHRKGNTERGISDVIACIRGKMVCIEVKAGKDKESIHQQQFGANIHQAKGAYFVVRSTDLFIAHFEQMLKSETF